jgi:hypothetical protein
MDFLNDNDDDNDDFDNSLHNPVNRIKNFLDYKNIEELEAGQIDHIRACVFVESYLEDPAVHIAVDDKGKFFAYLDQDDDRMTDSARGWSEREVAEWVTHVEAYQANNGGI